MDDTEFPRENLRASRHGDYLHVGYAVEARCNMREPRLYEGKLLGKDWTELTFQEAPPGHGVPKAASDSILNVIGLMNYACAQAMRWWFHASCAQDSPLGDLGLETRLVVHSIKLDYEVRAIDAIEKEDDVHCRNYCTGYKSQPTST